MNFTSAASYRMTLRWAERKARLEASAVREVVDALHRLDAGVQKSHFAGHLDLQRIGAFGFSFGGAVAAEAAALDPRIRAAVDMDGWIFADAAQKGVSRPFMIISSAPDDRQIAVHPDENRYTDMLDAQNVKEIADGFARYGGYSLTIVGADHYNFCDAAVLPSLRHTGMGSISGWRGSSIVGSYLVQFFDRFLNGKSAPLLEGQEKTASRDVPLHRFDPAAHLEIWHSAIVGAAGDVRPDGRVADAPIDRAVEPRTRSSWIRCCRFNEPSFAPARPLARSAERSDVTTEFAAPALLTAARLRARRPANATGWRRVTFAISQRRRPERWAISHDSGMERRREEMAAHHADARYAHSVGTLPDRRRCKAIRAVKECANVGAGARR
jgi:hypothetical protein